MPCETGTDRSHPAHAAGGRGRCCARPSPRPSPRRAVEGFALEGARELVALRAAKLPLLLALDREADLVAPVEVVFGPVALPRRQIVRAHADKRVARIGAGRRELAIRRLFEIQRP